MHRNVVLRHGLLIMCLLPCTQAAAEVPLLDHPYGLAIDSHGNLLVSCRGSHSVVMMTRAGQKVREIGDGRLRNPGGLCVASSGQIIVANTDKNELVVFDDQGRFIKAVGGLASPEDVTAAPDGSVFVADTGHSRVVMFDQALREPVLRIEQTGEPPTRFARPVGVCAAHGMLAVADAGLTRVVLTDLPCGRENLAKATVIPIDGAAPRSVAVGPSARIYAAAGGQVRGFTAQGRPLGVFDAQTLRVTITNLFQPGGLTVDPQGNVLAVDQHTGRVFVTNPELLDPRPEFQANCSPGVIEWTTSSPQPTLVEYGKSDDYGSRYEDKALTLRHRALLKDLAPATCYHCRVGNLLEMIPETGPPRPGFSLAHQKKQHQRLFGRNVSGDLAFASLPEPGKTDWASLPVVVLVYRNVGFPARDGIRPPNRVLDDGDIATLKSEMERYRLWLWRQTACKLNLAFAYVVVDQERDHNALGGITSAVFEDIQRGVKAQGKDLHDFWNVIVVGTHGWYANYLDGQVAGSEYELASCYTSFGHGQKPGWYWFPVHEHGHLVHSICMNSGLAGFAFPDAPWTMPGQFGEDFSFMAANYRRQSPRSWLTLRSTRIYQSDDANGNGVPDDDPRVSLDEKRFGWKASMGGDCLKRLMAGVRTPGYPGGTDTDFEGKIHPLEEGGLTWIDRNVPKAKIVLDGRIGEGEWKELHSLPNLATPQESRGLRARLYAAWDEQSYYFAIKSDRPVIAGFDLDAANDGWFHGRDNLRFSVRPPTSGRKLEASGAIWDFLNNRMNVHDGQLWYREAYEPGDIRAAVGEQASWHVIECAVPARPAIGIAPGAGARFALRAYLWSDTPGASFPQTNFLDGEDFVYDLKCAQQDHVSHAP